jgi:hypothetical protein
MWRAVPMPNHGGMAGGQVWTDTVDGAEHRVEVDGSVSRTITWTVDGETVAERRTMDDKARLDGGEHGRLVVVHSALGTPRRATLHPPGEDAASLAGVGGRDLTPEPGSRAAAHEEAVLRHPGRYTAIQTLGGVAKVLVPIVVAALLARVAFSLPLPDIDLPLPGISLPEIDLPLPSVSLPDVDLPDVAVPGWVTWLLDKVKYVWPIVLAYVLARREIQRRRRHAEQRDS